jgi:nicotinate dehydrogenase subunit B
MADDRLDLDIERYELFEARSGTGLLDAYGALSPTINRRDFIKTFGTGLVVLLVAPQIASGQESGRGVGGGANVPSDVSAWLHIADDGVVTAFTGKTEIGQNIRTSLTQAVAEELRAPLDSITLVMADTAKTPFDMGTFGSRTTPTMNSQLRKVAAAARAVLVDRAAARWNVGRDTVTVKDGRVVGGGRSIAFGELMKGTPLVATVNEKVAIGQPAQWTIAGTSVPKINGREFVTGRHRYTSDMQQDGLLYGKVVRPPAFGATLTAADTSAAQKTAGVTIVRDGNFLGVAAPSPALAAEAAGAIKTEWTPGTRASARTLFSDLKTNVEDGNQPPFVSGSIDAAFARADVTVEGEYTVAYIAHAPLEPRAAVAEWQDGKLTVWTGTQRPFGVQQELADAFRLPADRIRVVVPDTGSAYGGKHTGDAAIEAARLARAAGGPVKVVWTREEEFAWAYFRPAGVISVRAAVQKDGTIVGWDFHNYNSGTAAIRTPYDIASQRIAFHPAQSPLRQGSYRGLAATANHFARESHMDDLARAVGQDPLAFRLRNLRDERLAAVLKSAADKFGWHPGPGRAIGLACGVEKGGYTACCVELEPPPAKRDAANVRLTRIVVAFECGAIVNPDGLHNQVEGAIVQGLGGALFEALEFEDGRVTNGRFSQYRVPRFSDVPPIEVVLLDRRDIPSAGAGETPIVGVAPAIGNAIFAATGARLRALPLVPNGLPTSTSQQ